MIQTVIDNLNVILPLLAALVGSLAAVLAFVATRTKTTADDKVVEILSKIETYIKKAEEVVPLQLVLPNSRSYK